MRCATIFALSLLIGCSSPNPEGVEYTVIRGDSLSKIAKRHDVTVADLKKWNALSDNTIHPGQTLRIQTTTQTHAEPVKPGRKSSRKAEQNAPLSLRRPAPKKCLPPPHFDDAVDHQMSASKGLELSEIRSSMNAILPHTLGCAADSEQPSGTLLAEIVVACTGQVQRVTIQDAGPYSQSFADCVKDTLRFASFPAHDFPDGYPFDYPLRFSF